ncbi:MAG TPA: MFS transporter [Ktedonobacteraceae bacterium]|nr:MFS transporter [Ktedonobacteraceae bacterium]
MSQAQYPPDSTGQGEQNRAPALPAKPVPLWRNRDYMLLWSGQIVSSTGTRASQLALPLLVLALTHSPAQAGLVGAIRGIPYALFILPAGALVDRWNRKLVMILCDTGRALALGSIPLALLLGHMTIALFYIVSLVEGTLFTFFGLAETACLPHVVAKEQLAGAAAQNSVIDSVSGMVGPSIGGILYGIARAIPFLTDAITYAASVLSIFFIKKDFQEERDIKPLRLWAEIGEGLSWLWRAPLIRFIALLTGGLILPVTGYSLILIVIAQGQHASSFTIGLILASGGIGSIVGAMLVAPLQRRFRFGQLMIGSTWLWGLTWLLFAVAPNPFVLGVAVAASFIVVPIYMSVQFGYRLSVIPDQLQGRVNSVFRLIAFGSEPVGMAITGFLLQAIGPIPAVLVLFVPQGILAMVATFSKHFKGK